MPRPKPDPELRSEFSSRINERLRRMGAAQIARVLEVTPQTVYNYRDGKSTPSPEVIRRAMEQWADFVISYRGKTFTLQDFGTNRKLPRRKTQQYELWDVIKRLDADSVEITVLKKAPSSVQLGLEIKFRSPRS